jgi:hypothetical protein
MIVSLTKMYCPSHLDTIMAVVLFTIILRVVLIESGRSFLLRSDGQYMLLGDIIMAVFLVLLYRTSHGIIPSKNTAMIVSLTKIYCPSDLKYKRKPTVYQNVTEHDNSCSFVYYYTVSRSDRQWAFFSTKVRWTIYATWWHYHGCIFGIIILCDVLIDSGCSFLLKVRWTIYCHQVKYIVHLTLSRKARPLSIRTSLSIIITKNTAMIVSLTKIYRPSDLK